MESSDKISFIKIKAQVLDDLVASIKEHIQAKTKERASWFEWHFAWKKAWLSKEPIDETTRKQMQEDTSVTKRLPVYK
jgi:small-conductance mechanosensitive channel